MSSDKDTRPQAAGEVCAVCGHPESAPQHHLTPHKDGPPYSPNSDHPFQPAPAKPAREVCAVCGEPESWWMHKLPGDHLQAHHFQPAPAESKGEMCKCGHLASEHHGYVEYSTQLTMQTCEGAGPGVCLCAKFHPAPAEPKREVGRLTVDRLHSYAMDYAKAGLGGDPEAAKRCLELEATLSSLQQPESARAWQPIETAPKGPWVLLSNDGSCGSRWVTQGHWDGEGWIGETPNDGSPGWCPLHESAPTHWQPLPSPPALAPSSSGGKP